MQTRYNVVRKVRNALPAKGWFKMEIAKITSKGQITIPVEIRKKLGLKSGDKILFVEEGGRIYVMNASLDAFKEAQRGFAGEAKRAGLNSEEDVAPMLREFREESVV